MKIAIQRERGFALLLAIIISSVVIAVGIAILNISMSQINLASTSRESEIAFQTASAGVDCLTYWRNSKGNEFAYPSNINNPAAPVITCFGKSPSPTAGYKGTVSPSSNGSMYRYTYQFDAGSSSETQCLQLDLYVMNASAGDITATFTNTAVGTNGTKTCNKGRVCNVLVSTGYNRACSDLSTSIFTVQRELTAEF